MIYKIIGWFWIITGAYFLIRPRALMRRLQRKSKWRLRSFFFIAAFIWGLPLMTLAWKQEGIPSKIFLIIGLLIIVKGVFFLTSKAAIGIIEWSSQRSPYVFRLYAFIQIVLGMFLNHIADK